MDDDQGTGATCARNKGSEDQDVAKGKRCSNFIGASRHAIGQAACGEFKTGFLNCSALTFRLI